MERKNLRTITLKNNKSIKIVFVLCGSIESSGSMAQIDTRPVLLTLHDSGSYSSFSFMV